MVGPGRQLVLTGAPGGGKTTLLDAAERVGLSVSHEVARAILRHPGGMALRVRDPLGFAEAMAAAHLREKARFAGHAAPVIFDRGLPDVVGFLKVSGLPVPPVIDRACGEVRYSGPILRAPAWRRSTGRTRSVSRAGTKLLPVTRRLPRRGSITDTPSPSCPSRR